MDDTIYNLRHVQLNPKDAALLWRFTAAWRKHDDPLTWRELRSQGLEKTEEDSLMDVIIDQYEYESRQGV